MDSRVERVDRGGGRGIKKKILHVSTRSARLSDNSAEELRELASKVGQVAYGVHEYFGNGLLEKVYECALEHRLKKERYRVERQKPLKVFDEDGFCVGEYFVDMLVNDKLIVELKAVKTLTSEHFAQILNYLKITRNPVGLLINFGSYKFERRTITS